MATIKIKFSSAFSNLKNRNVEVLFSSINCSLWQKIVFQGTQKDSILLLETHIASNLLMQTIFYGELGRCKKDRLKSVAFFIVPIFLIFGSTLKLDFFFKSEKYV